MSVDIGLVCGGAALAGAASAIMYARGKRWADAALALLAGISLAGLLAAPVSPGGAAPALLLNTGSTTARAQDFADDRLAAGLAQMPSTPPDVVVRVRGHGLREAQWQDMPLRRLDWQPPKDGLLWLDFPRSLALGRIFALSARRGAPQADWRLQLLAENGQLLSESRAASGAPADALTVQWQPPMAESMVLQARLLDKDGATIAQGPVPLRVQEPSPLQVRGRFGAPSFDARVLNQLLTDSNAIVDWQTTLGKALTRSEEAREPLTHPNLLVADAAWLERGGMRGALAQAAQGVPLLVLGGNAGDAAQWQRELGLKLAPQSETIAKEGARHLALAGATLELAPGTQMPAASGGWQAVARDRDGKAWLWQRGWQKGRILWLGVRDWHRYAISEPAALGQWWQQVMDLAASRSEQKVRWLETDPMPLPGLRTEICAQGVKTGDAMTAGRETLRWQPRSERADAACTALWPREAGWLPLRSGDAASAMYVFGAQDWPAWQAALRHDATARYASRSGRPVARSAGSGAPSAAAPLPRWLLGILFAASMLLLWWRERR